MNITLNIEFLRSYVMVNNQSPLFKTAEKLGLFIGKAIRVTVIATLTILLLVI